MGLPYVLSSDLVSAYPAKSLEIAQYVDGQVPLLAMTQNAQTGTTYTFVLTDFTKLVTLSNASPVAVTLPLESSVAWPASTQLRLLNQGAGTVTVAGAVGVTINGTPLTLAQYKGANLIKTGTNTWTFVPFASGSASAVISSTTGSPTITTDAGATVYKFTGDGTFVVGTAGLARVLVVAAGSGAYGLGGGGIGGGAGGMQDVEGLFLPAATYTVKIGAGTSSGSSNGTAGDSYIDGLLGCLGGGGFVSTYRTIGASTGAGDGTHRRLGGQGNEGFTGYPGGGGGAGGVGTSGTGAGTIGPGRASDIVIKGTSVTYAAGGQGGLTNDNGPANTGNGGAGQTGSGGSGLVVVRVG
jgi:hypothetical protein